MSNVKQGLGEYVNDQGQVVRYFYDHFGDDFDMHICNAMDMDNWGPPEDPEEFEQMMDLLLAGDEQDLAEHITLVDLADDGTLILENDDESDFLGDEEAQDEIGDRSE